MYNVNKDITRRLLNNSVFMTKFNNQCKIAKTDSHGKKISELVMGHLGGESTKIDFECVGCITYVHADYIKSIIKFQKSRKEQKRTLMGILKESFGVKVDNSFKDMDSDSWVIEYDKSAQQSIIKDRNF